MTRLATWIWLSLGGTLYAAAKLYFGYPVVVQDLLGAVYWSGAALFVHWLNEQSEKGF